jgi:hypothetical protein
MWRIPSPIRFRFGTARLAAPGRHSGSKKAVVVDAPSPAPHAAKSAKENAPAIETATFWRMVKMGHTTRFLCAHISLGTGCL